MEDHREPDRADALGHGRTDVLPAFGGTIKTIDAAVILLIEAVGQRGVHSHAVRVVTVFGIGIGQKVRSHTAIERLPIGAAIVGFEHASTRHADVDVLGIARIDQHRVQLGAVGRCVLVAAAPCLALWVIVEPIDAAPRGAAVFGAEESLRRGSGIPDAGCGRMPRRQPERMVHDTPATFAKRGWLLRLMPGATSVGGSEDGRSEMPGARRSEHALAVAGVGDAVMDDVAEKLRPREPPGSARCLAVQLPQPFSCRNKQRRAATPRRLCLRHFASPHCIRLAADC